VRLHLPFSSVLLLLLLLPLQSASTMILLHAGAILAWLPVALVLISCNDIAHVQRCCCCSYSSSVLLLLLSCWRCTFGCHARMVQQRRALSTCRCVPVSCALLFSLSYLHCRGILAGVIPAGFSSVGPCMCVEVKSKAGNVPGAGSGVAVSCCCFT
jgi:hypothetical protein